MFMIAFGRSKKLQQVSGIILTRSSNFVNALAGYSTHYEQGQSPGPGLREYFYYIDHQGMLFLDDARMKNFTSCFKDKKFLRFFFDRLQMNKSDRYREFPYVSPCGREMNYIRCDDLPCVYSHLIPPDANSSIYLLRYNHGDDEMVTPFQPEKLTMDPATGRVYHPAPQRILCGPVALVHTKIAILLASFMRFDAGEDGLPSHITWDGACISLDHTLLTSLKNMNRLRHPSLEVTE